MDHSDPTAAGRYLRELCTKNGIIVHYESGLDTVRLEEFLKASQF